MAILAAAFVISRVIYYQLGLRFDAAPLNFYTQYIDPALLRGAFWQSLFYLKEQTPGYNFYLGTVLHLFPTHSTAVFHITNILLGFAASITLFILLDRLRVDRRIGLVIATVFVVSPAAALYENWLFYAYPITALFCLAALFLHRYASSGRMLDGALFFWCLATIGVIRSAYHLLWFGLIAIFVVAALSRWRRRTMAALALPALLLSSIYVKNFILFGKLSAGSGVYVPMNFGLMAVERLPHEALTGLIESKKISRVLETDIYGPNARDYVDVAPAPPRTGVPVLDEAVKSTGAPNWNCLWMTNVGSIYGHDAQIVIRRYPKAFLRKILSNAEVYFLPADKVWPYLGPDAKWAYSRPYQNAQALSVPLSIYDGLTAGEPRGTRHPWILAIVLPIIFVLGSISCARWLIAVFRRQQRLDNPKGLMLVFILFNIGYLTAVTVLLGSGDHNRYRDEVSGLFAVLLALPLSDILKRIRVRQSVSREPAITRT